MEQYQNNHEIPFMCKSCLLGEVPLTEGFDISYELESHYL